MTNFIRRLVSGQKARYRDDELDLELDLVYVTDRIIIMGYPATSLEGVYRNRREDAKKFLDHRHRSDYWIFNFCPLQENSYPASAFGGRVSRYPFPDHHAPPLAILPLATREIRLWLDSNAEHVAVLHCKAGKGRSGTLACAFLLSLDEEPSPPKLSRSQSAKQEARQRADDWMKVVEEEGVLDAVEATATERAAEKQETKERKSHEAHPEEPSSASAMAPGSKGLEPASTTEDGQTTKREKTKATLDKVLNLHTQRRMRQASSPDKPQKAGVSIPSQRRWLHYWSQVLSNTAPSGFWGLSKPLSPSVKHQARIMSIVVRLREPSGAKHQVVKAANAVLDRAAKWKGKTRQQQGTVWISLARYNDQFVEMLEDWEMHTRHPDTPGKRQPGSEHRGEKELAKVFDDGSWDRDKMVRRFATLGHDDEVVAADKFEQGEEQPILTYNLKPLDVSQWMTVRKAIEKEDVEANVASDTISVKSNASDQDFIVDACPEEGVVVDAWREVRAKLYMGLIPMGWFWFIPAFHLSSSENESHIKLTRKEVDFSLGPGDWLIDVDVHLKWERDSNYMPAHQMSVASDKV